MMSSTQDLATFALALVGAFAVDWASERRGLLPVAFRFDPADDWRQWIAAATRRGLAFMVLAGVLWVGVFGPLAQVGLDVELDLEAVPVWQLFLVHLMLVWGLGIWIGLGRPGLRIGGSESGRRAVRQLGLEAAHPWRELGIGLAGGVVAWVMVIVAVLILTGLVWALGAEDLLPAEPPEFVLWIVALPAAIRLALSLSAGVVEELFFRGFLQPRIGLGLSSLFFVVAHVNYGQPLMLGGVALLSVFFGLLAIWRGNIWAAVAAHFVFDAIQLLIVIPRTLEWIPEDTTGEALAGGLLELLSRAG